MYYFIIVITALENLRSLIDYFFDITTNLKFLKALLDYFLIPLQHVRTLNLSRTTF